MSVKRDMLVMYGYNEGDFNFYLSGVVNNRMHVLSVEDWQPGQQLNFDGLMQLFGASVTKCMCGFDLIFLFYLLLFSSPSQCTVPL